VDQLSIKISGLQQIMSELSGGNQQKVIIGRWLLSNPKILILDEPTRGIDVGSKAEIHSLICRLAKQGVSIILVSSEMPEILGISDRIIVVREGRLVFETVREEASQELLMKYAFGV
jgi:inositol transport system ATP-binding protein